MPRGALVLKCLANIASLYAIGLADDHASPRVAPTPPRSKDHGTKRKETLRSLLTALEELSKDDSEQGKGICLYSRQPASLIFEYAAKVAFEDDRDVRMSPQLIP